VAAERLSRAAALAAALATLPVGLAAAAPLEPPITQAQSGKTFRLAKGDRATLRLSGRWGWSEPKVSSRAIELTPILFFRDPGYSEWQVTARARGKATIRSFGKPGCTGCGLGTRSFRVTITVA
jgi:hypothetical protein